jgi:fucose permease
METENVQTKWEFISLIIVFFWVRRSANDILIPVLKSYIVPTSVAISGLGILCRLLYWIHHFLLGLVKVDILQKFGYKKHFQLDCYFRQ